MRRRGSLEAPEARFPRPPLERTPPCAPARHPRRTPHYRQAVPCIHIAAPRACAGAAPGWSPRSNDRAGGASRPLPDRRAGPVPVAGRIRALPALPGRVADRAARTAVLPPASLDVRLPALAPAVGAEEVHDL